MEEAHGPLVKGLGNEDKVGNPDTEVIFQTKEGKYVLFG